MWPRLVVKIKQFAEISSKFHLRVVSISRNGHDFGLFCKHMRREIGHIIHPSRIGFQDLRSVDECHRSLCEGIFGSKSPFFAIPPLNNGYEIRLVDAIKIGIVYNQYMTYCDSIVIGEPSPYDISFAIAWESEGI